MHSGSARCLWALVNQRLSDEGLIFLLEHAFENDEENFYTIYTFCNVAIALRLLGLVCAINQCIFNLEIKISGVNLNLQLKTKN